MYNFYDYLSSVDQLDLLTDNSDFGLQTVDLQLPEFLTTDVGSVFGDDISLFGGENEQVNNPIFDTSESESVTEANPLLSASVTIDAQGDMTSCCPCVACSGQNEEADFVGVASLYEGMHMHSHAAPDVSTLVGSDGYNVPLLNSTAGSNLTFTLNDTGGVGAGSQAEAGFLAAIALWQSFIADDVNIRLDLGFQSLAPGVLGQAGSARAVVSYADYRDALIADGTSVDDALAIANLELGDTLDFATQDQNGNFILDDNCLLYTSDAADE